MRTTIKQASGDFSLIEDADLENNPSEYPQLLRPLLDGRADAVFGSRYVLQSHPSRSAKQHPDPLGPVRLRAGDRDEERRAHAAHLRSPYPLSWPSVRKREDN